MKYVILCLGNYNPIRFRTFLLTTPEKYVQDLDDSNKGYSNSGLLKYEEISFVSQVVMDKRDQIWVVVQFIVDHCSA